MKERLKSLMLLGVKDEKDGPFVNADIKRGGGVVEKENSSLSVVSIWKLRSCCPKRNSLLTGLTSGKGTEAGDTRIEEGQLIFKKGRQEGL